MLGTLKNLAIIGRNIRDTQSILRVSHIRVSAGIDRDKSELMLYKAGRSPNPIEKLDDKLCNQIRDLLKAHIFLLENLAREYAENIVKEEE